MPGKKRKDKAPAAVVEAVAERFRVFLEREFGGNQSALAERLNSVSQPAISRVAAGDQLPGATLLTALVDRTAVNVHWLLTGQGAMLRGGGQASTATRLETLALPVAERPLPGPPGEWLDFLAPERLENLGIVPRPSQYLLLVQGSDPIVRNTYWRVQERDFFLMETDRRFFPAVDRIDSARDLWVVRIQTGRAEPQYRLAVVEVYGDDEMTADTFDLRPVASEPAAWHVRTCPGGELRGRPVPASATRPKRTRPRTIDVPRDPYPITPADLIAYRLLLLRR